MPLAIAHRIPTTSPALGDTITEDYEVYERLLYFNCDGGLSAIVNKENEPLAVRATNVETPAKACAMESAGGEGEIPPSEKGQARLQLQRAARDVVVYDTLSHLCTVAEVHELTVERQAEEAAGEVAPLQSGVFQLESQ